MPRWLIHGPGPGNQHTLQRTVNQSWGVGLGLEPTGPERMPFGQWEFSKPVPGDADIQKNRQTDTQPRKPLSTVNSKHRKAFKAHGNLYQPSKQRLSAHCPSSGWGALSPDRIALPKGFLLDRLSSSASQEGWGWRMGSWGLGRKRCFSKKPWGWEAWNHRESGLSPRGWGRRACGLRKAYCAEWLVSRPSLLRASSEPATPVGPVTPIPWSNDLK